MSLCCRTTATRFPLPYLLRLGRRRRHDNLHLHTVAATSPASRRPAAYTSLSPPQQQQVAVYVDALLDWNQRMNLTAVTEAADVMTRHVDDSLAVLPPLERAYAAHCGRGGGVIDGLSVVDVGSGAGLPGLILAVARPRQNAGQCLDFREAFDVAVARAVAELKILAEYCLPLVRVGGLFIAAKGHDPHKSEMLEVRCDCWVLRCWNYVMLNHRDLMVDERL